MVENLRGDKGPVGHVLPAMVRSVNQKSLHPLYLEVDNQLKGYCSVFDGGVSRQLSVVNDLAAHFQPG